MAINKTISANGSKGHHTFTLYVEETSTSENNSYLSGSFKLSPIQSGWDWNRWGDTISYSVNIGGNVLTGSIPQYDGSSVYYLQSFNNIKIPHESDGTKTITISFEVDDETGAGYTCGNASASSTMTLSQLHKKPEISSVTVLETGFPDNISVDDYTLVNLLSVKHFFITPTLYDNATLKQVDIYSDNFSFSFNSNTESDMSNLACWFKAFNINASKSTITATIKITDSLGSSNLTYIDFEYIDYQYPMIVETQSDVKRNGQISGKAKLNLLGSFANLTIGGITNSINLKYRYYEYGVTPSDSLEYIDIPTDAYDIDNNSISIYNWNISKDNVEIMDLDKNKSYIFEIILTDNFTNDTSSGSFSKVNLICSKGVWLMAKFKDRVDFKKITVQGNDPFVYSTEETIIGTWIDGKPLYQKVMEFTTSIGANYTTDIAHNISDVDLIFVKNAFLVNNNSSDSYYGWSFPLPVGLYKSNTDEDKLGVVASRYGVRFYVETSWGTAWTKYVILNYTKSTDEGGL